MDLAISVVNGFLFGVGLVLANLLAHALHLSGICN